MPKQVGNIKVLSVTAFREATLGKNPLSMSDQFLYALVLYF